MKLFFGLMIVFNLFSAAAAAQDSWRYPGSDRGASGDFGTERDTYTIYSSREIEDSFKAVADWYAAKLQAAALTEAIQKYDGRGEDAPNTAFGSINSTKDTGTEAHQLTTIIYAFCPAYKHVTALCTLPSGEIITVSVVGNTDKTTVQFIRTKFKD